MSRKTIIQGVHAKWTPLLLMKLFSKSSKNVLFIADSNKKIDYIYDFLKNTCYSDYVLKIPEFESDIYERSSYESEVIVQRANALDRLSFSEDFFIILATVKSVNYLTVSKDLFLDKFEIKKGQKTSIEKLCDILQSKGYVRKSLTAQKGDYSVRGGIVDVFLITSDMPCRIDFFSDVVESIKLFDKETQQSVKSVDNMCITRAGEIIPCDKINRLYAGFVDEKIKSSLERENVFLGMEWFLPMFSDNTCCFSNYINDNTKVIIDFEAEKTNAEFFTHIEKKYLENPTKNIHFSEIFTNTFLKLCDKKDLYEISPFLRDERSLIFEENNFSGNIRIKSDFKKFLNDLKKQKEKQVFLSVQSVGAVHILSDIFRENVFDDFEVQGKIDFSVFSEKVRIVVSNLAKGCIFDKFVLYTEQELFGYVLRSSSGNKRNIFKNYDKLKIGDYVVHKNHGKAIFKGIDSISVDNVNHDFLCLVYKGDDKLFVPVENIDSISPYSSADPVVELDKLGSRSWENKKSQLRKKLLTIADDLLKIAAEREMKKITPAVIDDSYEKFCEKFPYIETEDQISAINDVINDLTSDKPMDRLVCGDVGFGKTEIALRAAFIVSSMKKQTVVLVPTTILADQHYNTFSARFEGFDVNIVKISGHVTSAEMKISADMIKSGKADIIVATHAALSEKLSYFDLGLLIVDEEQKFGVKQKEFLKSMKKDIHVLTLSATPIPRTLQLAVSGVRDLSIICSPPLNRLPVKIFVCEFNSEILKNAIENELKRGGQVFIVSPRIEFIEDLKNTVEKCVPSARIVVVHGRKKDTEKSLQDFCSQKADILLSTNIIDSGIDIRNANTIIITRPDLLGLSQIYQLKGRVGRSKIQAYSYIMLPEKKKLTEESRARIEVIQNMGSLGSGFLLASYDQDIRGVGNIVGEEQSGYIKDVGVELYQTMLQEMILMKKAGISKDCVNLSFVPQINIGVPVFISSDYIDDQNLRISTYRRVADIKSEHEADMMEMELSDRFGHIPEETYNLMKVIRIKSYCLQANIEKIETGTNGVLISFFNNTFNNPFELLKFIEKNNEIIKIRGDQKIFIIKKWKSVKERTNDILFVVKTLAKMNSQ